MEVTTAVGLSSGGAGALRERPRSMGAPSCRLVTRLKLAHRTSLAARAERRRPFRSAGVQRPGHTYAQKRGSAGEELCLTSTPRAMPVEI
eukprot:7314051-Pyramimonas_sp.AAC.1